MCVVSGDPHYRSFDGKLFNDQGLCEYSLSKTCLTDGLDGLPSFELYAMTEARNGTRSVSYPMYVDIKYNGINVRLSRNPTSESGFPVIATVGPPVSALV